jgi:hypothetical protein
MEAPPRKGQIEWKSRVLLLSPLGMFLVLWSVSNQDGERCYSKEECLQEPEELSLAVCDSFILAQYHGI